MAQLNKSPQVHFIGKIAGATNFNEQTLYMKYNIKAGINFTLIDGSTEGDTFQTHASKGQFIPFEQPFDLNYVATSIRGWPKMFFEVWQVDSTGRNSIAGYGVTSFPFAPGEYKLSVPCWRPQADFYDKLIGAYPELIHKDILFTSDNRYGLKTESTGQILIELSVLTKDFHLHGVKLSDKDKEQTEEYEEID